MVKILKNTETVLESLITLNPSPPVTSRRNSRDGRKAEGLRPRPPSLCTNVTTSCPREFFPQQSFWIDGVKTFLSKKVIVSQTCTSLLRTDRRTWSSTPVTEGKTSSSPSQFSPHPKRTSTFLGCSNHEGPEYTQRPSPDPYPTFRLKIWLKVTGFLDESFRRRGFLYFYVRKQDVSKSFIHCQVVGLSP